MMKLMYFLIFLRTMENPIIHRYQEIEAFPQVLTIQENLTAAVRFSCIIQ